MKVLNISSYDYANYAHENANALRSIGVSVDDVCLGVHPFSYESSSKRVTKTWIGDHFMMYDVIQLFHTDPVLYEIVNKHPKIMVYHTGTRYRREKERFDELFKGRMILTDQCEFLLHDPSFIYVAPHVTLQPKTRNNKKLVIGHYPSNHEFKGTVKIEEMLKPFENDFDIRIDIRKVSHAENLKRVAECDIYVELFAPLQENNIYGCFGVTAFEATALGCLVVTNNVNRSAYEDVYGSQPFFTPNSEREFNNILLSLSDRETFEIAKEAMHSGFHEKHGIQAAGKRIKSLIEECIQR